MDNITAFINAVSLIAAGLKEKEDLKEIDKYPFSKKFLHGINVFFTVYARCTDKPVHDILQIAHEEAFFSNFVFKPVCEWIADFRDDIKIELEREAKNQINLEQLAYDMGEGEFHITEDCLDYLNAIGNDDVTAELEEQRMFNLLKQLSQSEYVLIRKFIIENPLADNDKIRQLKIVCNSNNAVECINFAYEEIIDEYYICPYCGWTMDKRNTCVSGRCAQNDFDTEKLILNFGKNGRLRLKRGIMRYIALPGRIELNIFDFCVKKGIKAELWPLRDKFDLEIVFCNGKVWEIDAKDYASPYNLREKIKNGVGFPEGTYDKGFYIIDDYLIERKKDYCEIIEGVILKKNVKCITFAKFKRLLSKELKNAGTI